MKTLRYITNHNISKSLNESVSDNIFDENAFKEAAAYALSQLDDLDVALGLKQINAKRPLDLIETGRAIADAMNDWCRDHEFDEDAWREFGSVEDVFFSDDTEESELKESAGDVNDEIRKMCFNAAYNYVLSRMSPKNTSTMSELNYAFFCGWNNTEFNAVGEDKDIYNEAYTLGKTAKEINSYQDFIDYLSIEY